ncbi:flagellar hook-associated protein FlgK [Mobilitalea sibirica]|uniref:Flagellar hook-associated protein 1 n=1 Tax=Mobilitalea sibirica TaxID=1462919 RepID=A0A8J7HCV4_9FIRM|nr:flagellar hook-associated protein FlgK [Mobilitalea sibirica]MBH1942461.1 flagellar hook-associated protein FlgK [Mobilitalea sibirica]
MGSLGGLYIGVSGLNVSQAALNVTSHNLANVDTKGFVRQQAVLTDFHYIKWGESHISSMQQGLGANFATVKQVRDSFLDQAYRQESGRQAFYESQFKAVEEVEGLFGELEGVSFQKTINDYWIALQELAKEPESIVARSSLIQTAVTFMERAENISKQLNDYQVNLNTQIINQVKRINEIGTNIKELNLKIRQYESTGVEKANDLRDQRNVLLDELAQISDITYKENPSGVVNVNLEGVPFVTEDTVYRMETMRINEYSEMLKPVWVAHGYVDVYNLDRAPSSKDNNDIGSLKGLLVARGYKQANYTDIPIRDNYETEALYNAAVIDYNNQINSSVIMSVQSQFDQLIHGIVTTMNDILSPNKEVTLSDGTKVMILDKEKAPVGMDPSKTMGEALFNRKSVARYGEPMDIEIEDGNGGYEIIEDARIYIPEDPGDNYSLFTLGEIEVNKNIMQNYSLIPLSNNGGTGDFDIEAAGKLLEEWQKPFATLSPNTLTVNNFNDYYTSFISEIANRGEQLNTISRNQASMLESIDNQRLQVTGVSSDEELTNLIKYQHAYNAAARYVNVVSEMLEHIVTKM